MESRIVDIYLAVMGKGWAGIDIDPYHDDSGRVRVTLQSTDGTTDKTVIGKNMHDALEKVKRL
jgi:hypothetical protein